MTPKQWHRYLIKKSAEYLYNNSIDGSFVECGVKQGSSSVIMARELKTKGYLFDTWKGFPHFHDIDITSEKRIKQLSKRVRTGKDTFQDCINNLVDNDVMENCTMIRGDICKTVPSFIKNNKIEINMLHIDTDLYEPAKISLDSFFSMIAEGGIIYFHDYGDKHWPGIRKIVDGLRDDGTVIHIFDTEKLFSAFTVKGVSDISGYVNYIQ